MASYITYQEADSRTLSRRRNFQQMIDIEKKQKITRMQSSSRPLNSIYAPQPPFAPLPPPLFTPDTYKMPVRASLTRHATAPVLTLAIPDHGISSIPRSAAPSSEDNTYKGAFTLPPQADQQDAAYDSDKSSLCQSPGWDDAETRKQKKLKQQAREKRKKEKEKAEKEAARQKQHQAKRLTKAPPSNRFSRMMITSDRSSSAPAVPTRSQLRNRTPPERTSSVAGQTEDTDKRGRAAQLTKSAHQSPAGSRPPSFHRLSSIPDDNGFIGGLKLREQEENIHLASQNNSSASPMKSEPQASIHSKAVRPAITKSKSVELVKQMEDDSTKLVRPTNKGHISKTSVDGYSHPDLLYQNEAKPFYDSDTTRVNSPEEESFTPSSTNSNSHNDETQRKINRQTRRSGASPERPPISYREPSTVAESRGRQQSNGYVNGHRQQSQNRSISGYENENKVAGSSASIKSQSRGRSMSIMSFGRRRQDGSTSRPPTSDSSKTSLEQDDYNYHDFLAGNYTTGKGPQHVPDPVKIPPPLPTGLNRRLSKFSPTGIKNAAKSAFNRHSHTPTSPDFKDIDKADPTSRNSSAHARSRNSSISMYSVNKADRVLGEAVVSSSGRRYIKKHQPQISESDPNLDLKLVAESAEIEVAEARTSTSSSNKVPEIQPAELLAETRENTVTADNSNLSTPTSTIRPREDQSPSRSDPSGLNSHPLEKNNSNEGVDKTLNTTASPDNHVNDQSPKGPVKLSDRARSESPRDLAKTVNRARSESPKELAKKRSTSNLLHRDQVETPPVPELKNSSVPVPQRRPSLSRSASTSDLQDLSFLPQLKHQPLTKPSKGKNISQPTPPSSSSSSSLSNPSTTSLLSSSSSSTSSLPAHSPISPLSGPSSAHLHKQRASIASPSAAKTRFPAPGQSTPMASIDPIAKMFVVCCSCRYFHDMPSKLYECMAKPDNVVEDRSLGVSGVVSLSVKCPWCSHGMSTSCCEGYAGIVYLRERLH